MNAKLNLKLNLINVYTLLTTLVLYIIQIAYLIRINFNSTTYQVESGVGAFIIILDIVILFWMIIQGFQLAGVLLRIRSSYFTAIIVEGIGWGIILNTFGAKLSIPLGIALSFLPAVFIYIREFLKSSAKYQKP